MGGKATHVTHHLDRAILLLLSLLYQPGRGAHLAPAQQVVDVPLAVGSEGGLVKSLRVPVEPVAGELLTPAAVLELLRLHAAPVAPTGAPEHPAFLLQAAGAGTSVEIAGPAVISANSSQIG